MMEIHNNFDEHIAKATNSNYKLPKYQAINNIEKINRKLGRDAIRIAASQMSGNQMLMESSTRGLFFGREFDTVV